MRIAVRHRTVYSYDAPVFLDPHSLRLRPKSDAGQMLESYRLDIEPAPIGRSETIDLDGNDVTSIWFEGLTEGLILTTESVVTTLRSNPFDYLWIGDRSLPVSYPSDLALALTPYRGAKGAASVRAFAEAAAAGGDAQTFPSRLAGAIHDSMHKIVRPYGRPRRPAETLALGEGSCRDLSVVYIAAARVMGFAARFVSGYLASHGVNGDELHAWAELYLPGGGWRGFDPSTGLAVAERHVSIAAARSPGLAAPVTGTYHGAAQPRPPQTKVSVQILD